MKLDLRSDGYVEMWLQEICVLDYDEDNSSKYVLGRLWIYDELKLIKNLMKTRLLGWKVAGTGSVSYTMKDTDIRISELPMFVTVL